MFLFSCALKHCKRACESEKGLFESNYLIIFNIDCQIFSESLCNAWLTAQEIMPSGILHENSVRNMQEEMKHVRSNTYTDNQPLPRNSWGWLKELPPVSTTDTMKHRPLSTNHCLFQHHQKKYILVWCHGRKLQDYISVNALRSMWPHTKKKKKSICITSDSFFFFKQGFTRVWGLLRTHINNAYALEDSALGQQFNSAFAHCWLNDTFRSSPHSSGHVGLRIQNNRPAKNLFKHQHWGYQKTTTQWQWVGQFSELSWLKSKHDLWGFCRQ